MSSEERGLAIIVNNEKFEHMTNRDGTHLDRMMLDRLFKNLNFKCICIPDKKSQVCFVNTCYLISTSGESLIDMTL